jgi:ribosomal protein L37AE/L43A
VGSFWDNVVAAQAPQVVYQPPPVQQQQGPWWAPQAYVQQPATPPPGVRQETVPDLAEEEVTILARVRKKAKSSKLTETCPECDSPFYFQPVKNSVWQCSECSYNSRYTTVGGGGLQGADGPTTPSKQLAAAGRGGKSQYQPQNTVAGRIDSL